jgi:biofilm PGA synthesis N-glycosyltransferase PgaC
VDRNYVIITPAFNEARYIEPMIQSVLAQTILPARWIIVDDGSTDETGAIVLRYASQYPFIKCLRRARDESQTYFGSNVTAITEGYKSLDLHDYEFLAVLDADIRLSPDYYQEVFRRLDANPELGVAAGVYWEEVNGTLTEALIDRMHTPKAIQVFRRRVYEQVGGYIPMKYGGEDSCAEYAARMLGWRTWSFPEIKVLHARPAGMGQARSILASRLRMGITEYYLATHPLFMLFKCLRRCALEQPYVLSGLARLAGFARGYIAHEPRQMPEDVQRFVRREQLRRLLACVGIGPKRWEPRQP